MNHNMRLHHNVIPTIRNYIEAANFWRDARPWRGQTGEHDYRPLGKWRKDHLKIHKGYEDEIRFRYYWTDCVIYWPDGSVTIKAYSSQSTNTFVRNLSPHGFKPDFIKADTMIWVPMWWEECKAVTETGVKFPRNSNVLRFKAVRDRKGVPDHWAIHEDSDLPGEFERSYLDHKATRAALKATNYYAFVPWANAVRSMMQRTERKRRPWERGHYKYKSHQLVDLLESGIEGWMKILEDRGSNCAAHVREAIYKETGGVVREERVQFIQGYADYESFMGNTRKLDNY